MIRFVCSDCKTDVSVPLEQFGQATDCPGCRTVLLVPLIDLADLAEMVDVPSDAPLTMRPAHPPARSTMLMPTHPPDTRVRSILNSLRR